MKAWPLLLLFNLVLVGCETDEQQAISAGQSCLNAANPGTAGLCRAMVDGHTSQEAYVIRCSSDFLAEGVNANTMAQALVKRDATSGNNKNALLGMMGIISFRTKATAKTAGTDCAATGIASYNMLAQMAKISTELAITAVSAGTLGSININSKPTQSQMETALADIRANPSTENLTTVGNAATVIHQNYCLSEKDTSKVCTTIAKAVAAASTAADIGTAVLSQLNTK